MVDRYLSCNSDIGQVALGALPSSRTVRLSHIPCDRRLRANCGSDHHRTNQPAYPAGDRWVSAVREKRKARFSWSLSRARCAETSLGLPFVGGTCFVFDLQPLSKNTRDVRVD